MRTWRQRAASRRNLVKARAHKTGGLTTMTKFIINKSADLATGGAAGMLSDMGDRQKRKARKKRKR